ncbi:membrane protein [Streptomyces sp. NRRL S-337]|uniref:membrane protein n=1 Tax=Streptomyces sp. NRRL S-337 TaxID=1463900 RepID=UPI0004C6F86D|nr:membrane protein [Streptomyces sp. NRRL S-337]
MRGNNRRRALAVTSALTGLQVALVLLSARAFAAPSPKPSEGACDLLADKAKELCEQRSGGSKTPDPGGGGLTDSNPLDPLESLAKGCAKAAAWIVNKLSDAVTATSQVDFTNAAFLRQYAVVFAASTVLTLVLWLLAVAKRAVRGVRLTEAISEAVGFLWLTVLASAFTPLILYTVVSATDGVTAIIAKGTGAQTDTFFGSFSQALTKGTDIGGGPIMLIVVSLVSVLAAGVLWLELVIRAALLYVGALLGTVVYAGLVDKNMWGHVRRWAGIMIAVIMVKPVIVIVLGIAGALSGDKGPNAISAVVSGLAIILLAIFASAVIYRFVPGFGDEIAASRNNRMSRGAENAAAAVLSSPAALVSQGIKTHSTRRSGGDGGGQPQGAQGGQSRPADAVSGGVAAHSSRTGGGRGPSPAAPAPRTNPGPGPSSSARTGKTAGGDGR